MEKELIKVTLHISYLPGEDETDQPYIYYIKGDSYSIAVDAGNSREQVEAFYEAIHKRNFNLNNVATWKWSEDNMKEREGTGEDIPFCNECICKVYPNLSFIEVCSVDIRITEEIAFTKGICREYRF